MLGVLQEKYRVRKNIIYHNHGKFWRHFNLGGYVNELG